MIANYDTVRSFNVITFGLAQRDHLKRLLLHIEIYNKFRIKTFTISRVVYQYFFNLKKTTSLVEVSVVCRSPRSFPVTYD